MEESTFHQFALDQIQVTVVGVRGDAHISRDFLLGRVLDEVDEILVWLFRDSELFALVFDQVDKLLSAGGLGCTLWSGEVCGQRPEPDWCCLPGRDTRHVKRPWRLHQLLLGLLEDPLVHRVFVQLLLHLVNLALPLLEHAPELLVVYPVYYALLHSISLLHADLF